MEGGRYTVDDLTLLDKAEEDAIANELEVRMRQGLLYTYVGDVLLFVNPYAFVKGLYETEMVRKYNGRHPYEVPPHIYATAENCYCMLRYDRGNQVVIISGESGSGKTEASKLIMQYITTISCNTRNDFHRIKQQIIHSNPLLETFGNACTMRNDNSSRFGKYVEILFNSLGEPVGARIHNFLLEKSRIVSPNAHERNYHIFYRLINGLSKRAAKALFLDPETYPTNAFTYLKDTALKKEEDKPGFGALLDCLKSLHISDLGMQEIFATVSAILWIGQIRFGEGEGGGSCCRILDEKPLDIIAYLIQCDKKKLQNALLTRQFGSGHSFLHKELSADGAEKTRDSLAKLLYHRLFNWIVAQVNRALHISDTSVLERGDSIGILDIYGFEVMESNSFEQFCINFVNEKLQQLCIEKTIQREQADYASEGVPWDEINYFNNAIVCDLIEKKPMCIFGVLDEECVVPKGNDGRFLAKLNEHFQSHEFYYNTIQTRKGSVKIPSFAVRHYAGEVVYTVEGFVEKNKDFISKDLLLLGESSKLGIFKGMFPSGGFEAISKKLPKTASQSFQEQVNTLAEHLNQCSPHYVRCIKSNDMKQTNVFDRDLVRHQIQYLGLVENVRLRRNGFSFRMSYERFVARYKMLTKTTWPTYTESERDATRCILTHFRLSDKEFFFGRTKIFIKSPTAVMQMEELRRRRLHDLARIIQSAYKSWKGRQYYIQLRHDAIGLYNGRKMRRTKSIRLFYVGDYIGDTASDFYTQLFEHNGDKNVLFYDSMLKVNKRYRTQTRYIMVTDRHLYMIKPQTAFNRACSVRHTFKLRSIATVLMSPFADNYLVLRIKNGPDFLVLMERKTEFLACLSQQLERRKMQLDIRIESTMTMVLSSSRRLITGSFFLDKTKDEIVTKFTKNSFRVFVGALSIATEPMLRRIQRESAAIGHHMREASEAYASIASSSRNTDSKVYRVYRAVADYTTEDTEEIAFKNGDVLKILEQYEDGWWVAEDIHGNIGFVPSTFFEEASEGFYDTPPHLYSS